MKTPISLTGHCRHTLLTLALAALLGGHSAQAATRAWNLAIGGDFNTVGNWAGGLPVAADTALFDIALSGDVTLSLPAIPGTINFDASASTFALGTLAGNTITIVNNGSISVLPTLAGSAKTFTVNAPLVLTPASTTTAGAGTIQNNATDSSNALVIAGGISSSATTLTETLTLGGGNAGSNTVSGAITNGLATTFAVAKTGVGVWTLAGSNTYTGATTINGGTLNLTGSLSGTAITANFGSAFVQSATGVLAGTTSLNVNHVTVSLAGANTATANTTVTGGVLNLDYSTQSNSKLADAGVLTLAGGTLNLLGGSHLEVVASTTLSNGAALIARGGGTSALRLNAITRNAGGTINLGSAGFVSTDTNNLGGSGILGGYATFNATAGSADWAATLNTGSADTPISGFTSYDVFAASGTSSNNALLTGTATLTGNLTANSLKINSSGASQALDLGTGKTLTLTTGGLMFTGASDYQINNGTLKSATTVNSDVIVQQWGTGTLTINSVIANGNGTSTLTKAGPGTLILNGVNTYTGATYLNEGSLRLSSGAKLAATALTVNGTLDLNNSSQTVDAFSGKSTGLILNNGNAAATLTIGQLNGSGTFTGVLADNNNAGTGTLALTKAGSNTVTLTGANTYTGATTVNAGNLTVNGPIGTLANSSAYGVTGATLAVGDSYVTLAGRLNAAAGLTLGGGNGGGTFTIGRPSVGSQNIDIARVTIGAGQSNFGANGGFNTGYLNAGAYSRGPGGIFSTNSGGGAIMLGFASVPTGTSVIGTGASAILIGGISQGGGYSFVKALAGTVTNPTSANDTYATGTNTAVTADFTVATATTTQSIAWGVVTKTLTLNAALTVESGGIALGNGATGVGTITGSGSLQAANGRDLWIGVQALTSTISATILDDGASSGLTKFNGGTLLLTGNNSFSGPIYLDQGTLAVGSANALGAGTAAINFLGGASGQTVTLKASGVDFTSPRNVVLSGGQIASVIDTNGQNVGLSGSISSTGTASIATNALSKIGAGILTLSGTNTFGGNTTITAGTLKLTSSQALGGSTFTGGAGTLVLDAAAGGNFTFGGLSGSTNLALTDSAAGPVNLSVGANHASNTYSGILSGAGGLTKVGTGTQTLTGLNTFSGGLTVKAGTVQHTANSFQPLGTGTITLGDSANTGAAATLNLNTLAHLTYANALATAGNGLATLNLVNYNGTFTNGLTMGGNLLLSTTNPNNSILTLSGAISGSGDLTLKVGGPNGGSAVILSGATINPVGTITNSGSGVGPSSISGAIGASVTGVVQNSTTSALSLTNNTTGNSFSGGITIKAGTVNVREKALGATNATHVGTITLGDSANTGLAATLNVDHNNIGGTGAGSNPINVVGTGARTLSVTSYNPIFSGAVILNGTDLTLYSSNSQGSFLNLTGGVSGVGNLTLQVTGAHANSAVRLTTNTINPTGTITNNGSGTQTNLISAAIGSNVTGVIQNSTNSALYLSGTVAYRGNTTVSAGTLRIANPNSNNETSTVTIASGATLQLDFDSNDTVGGLIIGATPQPDGVYGSVGSGAEYEIPEITGAGNLTVTSAGGNYASWATSSAISGEPAAGDFDHDGLSNLVEYALGANPAVSSQPAGTFSDGVLTFTKGSEAIANNDVIFEIEESTDLGISDPWATVVTEGTEDDTPTITYTLPIGVPKEFARLKITQVP